jgi:RNA polymerase sigma-70 factor (ECF subfamily)
VQVADAHRCSTPQCRIRSAVDRLSSVQAQSMDYASLSANDLVQHCAHSGNGEAWREFLRRFQRPIALVVLRTARRWGEPATTLVDDLVQDTFLRLCADDCRLLRGFESRGEDSIIGYLKVIAANVTHDHFRARTSTKRGGEMRRVEGETDGTEYLPAANDQVKEIETGLQIAEIHRTLETLGTAGVSERDRTIFWLYYRQGFSARDIGEIPTFGLTVKGVESSIHRTTGLVRKALEPPPPGQVRKGTSPTSTIWKEER